MAEKPKCNDCKYLHPWGYNTVCYNYRKSLSGFITSGFNDACSDFVPKDKED